MKTLFIFICSFIFTAACTAQSSKDFFVKDGKLSSEVKLICFGQYFDEEKAFHILSETSLDPQPRYNRLISFRQLADASYSIPAFTLNKDGNTLYFTFGHDVFSMTKGTPFKIDRITFDSLPGLSNQWSWNKFIAATDKFLFTSASKKRHHAASKIFIYKCAFPLSKNGFEKISNKIVSNYNDKILSVSDKSLNEKRNFFYSNGEIHEIPFHQFEVNVNKNTSIEDYLAIASRTLTLNNLSIIDFSPEHGWLFSAADYRDPFNHIYMVKTGAKNYESLNQGTNAFWGPNGSVWFYRDNSLFVRDKNGKAITAFQFSHPLLSGYRQVLSRNRRWLAIKEEGSVCIFDLVNRKYCSKPIENVPVIPVFFF